MVSFFKRKSIGDLVIHSPNANIKSPRATIKPENPKTPPITPEPESPPDSSLQVLIVAEPKDSCSESMLGASEYEHSIENSSYTQSIGLQSRTADSLLNTVINGMGCVPVSELPSWTTRAGGSLITIPENSIIPPTPVWGVAPSFDSDSESFESLRHVHYDNFEMVLDEHNLESDKVRKRLDDSMKMMTNVEAKQESLQKNPLFCQPCTNNAVREGIQGEMTLIGYQELSNAAPVKETLEEKVEILETDNRSQGKKDGYKGTIRSPEIGDTQISNSESVKKALFDRKSQKIKQKKNTKAKSSRFEKLLSKRFSKRRHVGRKTKNEEVQLSNHNKKRSVERNAKNEEVQLSTHSVTQNRSNKDNDVKEGRWKCATDVKNDKVYFYHTGTKEVSWEKPDSFVEWRVTVDLTTGKTCFVNRITKEATLVKPEGVQEWKEVKDATTGNTYYYSIFTRETSWIKPNDSVEPKEDSNTINPVAVISIEKEELVDKKVEQKTAHERPQPNTVQPEIEKVHLEAVANVEYNITEDSKILKETAQSEHKINDSLPKISSSPPSEKLASLLSKYCPTEKDMNLQLIQTSIGQETLVIKAIEALVDDTPFDELQLSIFSYVKSVLQSMGEDPYDENVGNRGRRGPPVTGVRTNLKRVQTMGSSTLSLNSRAVSHMTGKSGITNKTNGTAETFRMTNTTKIAHKGFDQSFEEDSITDEDDSKKLIFDIRVLEEDNLGGRGRVQNKVKEKKKANCARRPPTPPRRNFVKRSTHSRSPLRRGEIDVCGSHELETESAYAADNDDETDIGSLNDGDDTISALSDSFGPSHGKRFRKERRLLGKPRQENHVPTKVSEPMPDFTRRKKSNDHEKIRDSIPVSPPPYIVKKNKNVLSTQHTPIERLPHVSTSSNEEPPKIRPGRSRQPRVKSIMKEDSLLPRYTSTGTYTDDDSWHSDSWDDDTVTTNPSLNISADERGGMYRYRTRDRMHK